MTSVPDFKDLEARMAIMALEGDYTKTWDTCDAEAWASLFTEDGVFEMISVGELPNARYHGRDALTKFCNQTNQEYSSILHLPSIPSLSIGESRIQGWINFEARLRRGVQSISVAGVYQVLYVLTPDGWRIQNRWIGSPLHN